MPNTPKRLRTRVLALASSALLLSACSTFQGHKEVNLAPFGENTLAMVSTLRLTVEQPVYMRPFMDANPDVLAARKSGDQIRHLLRGIILYSLQVSAIGNSHLDDKEKVQELVRYLNETLRPAVLSQKVPITLTEPQLDSVLNRVRAQTKYLAALGEATPIVEEVVETTDQVVTEFENHVLAAEAALSGEVDAAYAPYRANDQRLQALEVVTMRRYVLLDAARLGDSTVLKEIRAADPGIGVNERTEAKELDRMAREAFDQLAAIRTLRDQLRGETELYSNRMKELDELASQSMITARATRSSIILWARAHRNMAAGLEMPPAIDVTAILTGISKSVPKL